MKVEVDDHALWVTREEGDPRMPNESTMLHHVKLILITKGHNLIKKRMWKDGHMVDDTQQYLRARNPKKLQKWDILYVWDTHYAERSASEDYNHRKRVKFYIEREGDR